MRINKVLMERDGLTEEQAQAYVNDVENEAYQAIAEGRFEDAFHACESVGLEPDYLEDILM